MNLSNSDLQRWLAAITNQPKKPTDLMLWVQGPLKTFFPFTRLFMAHGELVAGQVKTNHWLQCGHATDYLQQLSTTFELEHRGSLKWWFANRRPFCIDPDQPPEFATSSEVEEIRKFSLQNVAAHGILNMRANAGTYFSFSGISGPFTDWHLDALQVLTPVLNDLYLAFMGDQIPNVQKPLVTLTPRQNEIVRLAVDGLDDKTIARSLGLVEKTVRNQLTNIYGRFGVHKRTQLLALLR